jgi:hypothetical protein
MTGAELLVDAFDRVRGVVHRAVGGLSPEQLAFQVAPEANSIAWLVWHLTRIQDDHVAGVAAVRVSGELLAGYHDAVHQQTVGYVDGLVDADLDRIVDRSWDPPVTLGVRLVSVIADDLQHAGQAAFVRGILQRR